MRWLIRYATDLSATLGHPPTDLVVVAWGVEVKDASAGVGGVEAMGVELGAGAILRGFAKADRLR